MAMMFGELTTVVLNVSVSASLSKTHGHWYSYQCLLGVLIHPDLRLTSYYANIRNDICPEFATSENVHALYKFERPFNNTRYLIESIEAIK